MLKDNIDFFEAEDIKQAMREARMPVCDCCGEHMSEWYELYFKGALWMFCKSCVTEKYWEE